MTAVQPLKTTAWMALRDVPWRAYLLVLPALSLVAVLFGGGLVLAFLQSVGLLGLTGDGGFSLAAYGAALGDEQFWRSLGLSLYIAFTATALSTVLSIGLAMLLREAGRWASFACQLTLPIPHLVGIAGILLLLSPSGLISRLLYSLGWIWISSDQDFPLLVNDSANIGVMTHFLWKEIPFMTLILLAVLRGIRPELGMQARALGATPWQCFWNVTLPLLRPGIVSASLIVFGFVFGNFEVPFLLGSTYPKTLPILVYQAFTNVDLNQRPVAIALGLLLSLISIALIALYLWLGSGQPFRRRLGGQP
ncbi:ABC transporter permease subunit [Nodosilinea sp. LEGE 07298]|uniref:ABC transporter permease n=1 Tax=Nodosilinea sp. LEGE 07298 TaxID=2777970 RepID=UPI00187F8A79|nr:ABC transporter permease subunit [Nodosilinea sp. LEGE 07298]MBE9111377.1 ABC transporter permease subunit [Nodosilinea sp. LEGE 07298]